MDEISNKVQDYLEKLLAGHGLTTGKSDEWIFTGETFPPVRASLVEKIERENSCFVQLDIDVLLNEEQLLKESFAGMGPTLDEAIVNAFVNFALNSLHVLLAAFWDRPANDQVTVEKWVIQGENRNALIGPFGLRGEEENDLQIPENFFSTIEDKIRNTTPGGKCDWFRVFVGNTGKEDRVYEFLRNNEPWKEGQDAIAQLHWPASEKFYSVRLFLVVREAG